MPFDLKWWAEVHVVTEQIGRNICGIYRFTHMETGAVYVGQSKNISERVKQHVRAALNLGPRSSAWHKALAAARGLSAFNVEVLEVLPPDPQILCERETYWLVAHGAGKSLQCYNTHPTGWPSPLGSSPSPVSYIRVSQKLKGRPRPEWVKAKISATKLTPEGRARNSAANKGRKHTETARRNMTAAQNRPEIREHQSRIRKGIPLDLRVRLAAKTPQARAKLSAALKGRAISAATREKIAATLRGIKHTLERRRNQSIARKKFLATCENPWKGRKHSLESRAKMSAARRKYFQSLQPK